MCWYYPRRGNCNVVWSIGLNPHIQVTCLLMSAAWAATQLASTGVTNWGQRFWVLHWKLKWKPSPAKYAVIKGFPLNPLAALFASPKTSPEFSFTVFGHINSLHDFATSALPTWVHLFPGNLPTSSKGWPILQCFSHSLFNYAPENCCWAHLDCKMHARFWQFTVKYVTSHLWPPAGLDLANWRLRCFIHLIIQFCHQSLFLIIVILILCFCLYVVHGTPPFLFSCDSMPCI